MDKQQLQEYMDAVKKEGVLIEGSLLVPASVLSELREAAERADELKEQLQKSRRAVRELIKQGIAVEAQRDGMEKALRPFAAIAASISKIRDDNGHFYAVNETVITYGDFRRAAEALKEAGNG